MFETPSITTITPGMAPKSTDFLRETFEKSSRDRSAVFFVQRQKRLNGRIGQGCQYASLKELRSFEVVAWPMHCVVYACVDFSNRRNLCKGADATTSFWVNLEKNNGWVAPFLPSFLFPPPPGT